MRLRTLHCLIVFCFVLVSQPSMAEKIEIPVKKTTMKSKDSITPDSVDDTMAFEGAPSQNYCSSNQIEIGRYDGDQAIGYLDFEDFELEAGATITGISIRLYKNSEANNGSDHDFYFAQIEESWSECSVTWNNKPDVDNGTIYGPIDLGGGSGWYEIPLPLEYATNEFESPNSWHGISIGPWRPNTDLLRFRSSEASSQEPFLIIEYEIDGTPDLIISAPSAPSDAAIGSTITLSCSVDNNGDGEAGSSNLGYFLSTNQFFDMFDIPLGDDGVRSLSPGEGDSESINATLDHPSIDPSNNPYYILFVADLDDEVPEGSDGEGNNVEALQITIHGPPSIGGLSSSENWVFEAMGFSLTATGVSGDEGNEVTRVDFYWDSFQDNILDPESDYLIGSDTTPGTWEVSIPEGSLVVGEQRFFAVAWNEYGLPSNAVTEVVRVAHSLYPVIDTNKPNAALERNFSDTNGDGKHTPGEAIGSGIVGDDNSCWMASAANLIAFRYGSADYDDWCENGVLDTQVLNPFWGEYSNPPNSGNKYTFDDTGFPHWVFIDQDIPMVSPITTDEEFEGGIWHEDPIAWCRQALENDDRPVSILIWWGTPEKGSTPGETHGSKDHGYHAITLWGVDEGSRHLLITDSDDIGNNGQPYSGYQRYEYEFSNGVWSIDYGTETAYINYACYTTSSSNNVSHIPEPELSSSSLIRGVSAFPNPFNPETSLSFDLSSPSRVDLAIYDIKGRLIKDLLSGDSLEVGSHQFGWNGTDGYGRKMPSGIYFFHIQAGGVEKNQRIVLIE